MIQINKSVEDDKDFREHILELFNIELKKKEKEEAESINSNSSILFIATLIGVVLLILLFVLELKRTEVQDLTYNVRALVIGLGALIILFCTDYLEGGKTERLGVLTKMYMDYLVTNDWEVFVDRPKTLISGKKVKLDCTYVLSIDDGNVNLVLTKEQFKRLKDIKETKDCVLEIDLRTMVQFEKRLNEREKYNNLDVYELYSKKKQDNQDYQDDEDS